MRTALITLCEVKSYAFSINPNPHLKDQIKCARGIDLAFIGYHWTALGLIT